MSRCQIKSKNLSGFASKVLAAVKRIPKGKVTTYKFLARGIGCPKAVRAVGSALKKNSTPIKIPCHRVVQSNGLIGNYFLGKRKKVLILQKEGIRIVGNKIENFSKILYQFKNKN